MSKRVFHTSAPLAYDYTTTHMSLADFARFGDWTLTPPPAPAKDFEGWLDRYHTVKSGVGFLAAHELEAAYESGQTPEEAAEVNDRLALEHAAWLVAEDDAIAAHDEAVSSSH